MNAEQDLKILEDAYNHPDWGKYWNLGYDMVKVESFPSKQSEIAYNNGKGWHLYKYKLKITESFESTYS